MVVVVVAEVVVVGVVVVVTLVVVGVVVDVDVDAEVEVEVELEVDVEVDVLVLGAGAGAETALVAFDVALVDPFLFVAVTETRSVRETSASLVRKVKLTAPASATQVLPAPSQRFH